MIRRATFLFAMLALAPYVPVADAATPVQGLTCGLRSAPAAPPGEQAGVVTRGPAAVTGELATLVIYTCMLRVITTGAERTVRFESPGPVGLVPPTLVTFRANPATDRVELCTHVEWVFGFPGGGGVDLGCREAAARRTGYEVVPDLIV